jgi:hypothetical protein
VRAISLETTRYEFASPTPFKLSFDPTTSASRTAHLACRLVNRRPVSFAWRPRVTNSPALINPSAKRGSARDPSDQGRSNQS